MLIKKPGFILMAFYALGQGGVFIFQAISKYYGNHELAGIAVLYVGLISFSLQFADFGSVTYLVPKFAENEKKFIAGYLVSRSIFAFFFSCIIAGYAVFAADNNELSFAFCFFMIAIAVFSSLSSQTLYEASKSYLQLAVCQSAAWISMGIALWLLYFSRSLIIVTACLVLLLQVMVFFHTGTPKLIRNSFSVRYFSWGMALPYMVMPLLGQVWGRISLIYMSQHVTLHELSDFGIFRYLQTAIVLLGSFFIRPALSNFLVSNSRISSRRALVREMFLKFSSLRWLVFLGFCFYILLVLSYVFVANGSPWGIIMLTIPFTLINSIVVPLIHSRGITGQYFWSELLALSMNVIIFFTVALVFEKYALAILFSEVGQAVCFYGFLYIFRYFSRRNYRAPV